MKHPDNPRTFLYTRKREIREKSNFRNPITIFTLFSFPALIVEGSYFLNLQNAKANLLPIYEPSSLLPEKEKNVKEVPAHKFLLFLFFWGLERLRKSKKPCTS